MDFMNLITSLGFPSACCIALAVYINKKDEASRLDHEKDKDRLMEEIKYNREVNSALLETNKLLSESIKGDLTEIKEVLRNK